MVLSEVWMGRVVEVGGAGLGWYHFMIRGLPLNMLALLVTCSNTDPYVLYCHDLV